MADLNALIAQGAQFQAPVDPFAQYAKMQQLNTGANQNALAQYQLAQAQRADVQANALNAAYASGINPDTGEIDYGAVRRSLAAGGAGSQIPALEKSRLEQQTAALNQQELLGKIAAQPVALAEAKTKAVDAQLKQSKEFLNLIDPTAPDVREQLLAWHQSNHQGLLGDMLRASGSTPEQTQGAIDAAVAKGPAGIADFIQKSTIGQTEFAKSIAAMPEAVTDGKTKFFVDKNPKSPTFGQKIGGAGFEMGMTPYETAHIPILQQGANAATTQANTGRAHLGLSAITADPFNLTGAQTAYPLGMGGGVGVSAGGVTGARPAVTPTGVPAGTGTPPKGESTIIGTKPVPLSVAINQGVKGTDLLAAMPAPLAAQIAAITDHRAAPPSRNTARADQLMQLVNLVDPTYDATSYKTKQGIETAFTSGRPGTLLKSLNVVQDHLGTFADTAKELGNSELPFVNAIGNKISQWTGQPAPTNFAAVKTVVADELTKAILGTAGALGDRNAMKEEINAASSPAMLAGVIGKWQKLIAGQVNGLSDQYKSGGGSNPAVLNLFGKAKTSAAPAAAGGEHPADIQAIIDAQKRK